MRHPFETVTLRRFSQAHPRFQSPETLHRANLAASYARAQKQLGRQAKKVQS